MPVPTDQQHVNWDAPAIQDVVRSMEVQYPGGVAGYVARAKQLLHPDAERDAAAAAATFRAELGQPAHRVDVDAAALAGATDAAVAQLERGTEIAGAATAFVLVAGGLGERLGAAALKVSLPVHTCGGVVADALGAGHDSCSSVPDAHCFLHHYVAWMLHAARGARANGGAVTAAAAAAAAAAASVPLIIMTSDDTHQRTIALLERNRYFGLAPGDVTLLKQSAVPCVGDRSGKLAVSSDGASFVMKPHGHGDVHRLILSSGLLPVLAARGVRYIVFMQDTNSGATTTIPHSLAIMETRGWAMSFTCVPRLPGEAIGALVEANSPITATIEAGGGGHSGEADAAATRPRRRTTYCVEYNVLDDMLKRDGYPRGDVAASASTPYSAFPGTINTLLLRLDAYAETVTRTEGVIAEFVNPKYADATKTTFKSPARLETLMQDIALELTPAANGAVATPTTVGAVVFDRSVYFPVKNALQDGIAKWQSVGIDPHNASQGEAGFFLLRRIMLARHFHPDSIAAWPLDRCVGARASSNSSSDIGSSDGADVLVDKKLPLSIFPILLSDAAIDAMSAAVQFPLSRRNMLRATRRSSLVLLGADVVVESLDLDGALVIAVAEQQPAPLVILDLGSAVIRNAGWVAEPVDPADAAASEAQRIRGFKYRNHATRVIRVPRYEGAAAVVATGARPVMRVSLDAAGEVTIEAVRQTGANI